jgi:hypothetical protein
MRILAALALAAAAFLTLPADAQPRGHRPGVRDGGQDAAFHAMQRGRILPLGDIMARVRIPGAQFIGAELNGPGTVYRLKFIRGGDVIWIDVDARTGRFLGQAR